MPVFNYAKKEVNVKVVYYGPGLSGKTTNLQKIHDGIKPEFKGKLVSLATQTDRTLFFDFMPLELGSLGGYKIRLHLYTVPGQVHYNATRKLVLKGVDGVVFVADSQRAMADANVESFFNLEKNLQSYGKSLHELPHVIQANKRDLDDLLPLDEIRSLLNRYGAPVTEAVASEGTGALETLSEIVRMVMKGLKDQFSSEAKEEAGQDAAPGTVNSSPPPAAAAPGQASTAEPLTQHAQPGTPSATDLHSPPVPPAPASVERSPVERSPLPGSRAETDPIPAPMVEQSPVEDYQPDPRPLSPDPDQPDPVQTVKVKVPVDGIGILELSIAITARIVEEGEARTVDVVVDDAAISSADRDLDQGAGQVSETDPVEIIPPEPAVTADPEPDPETIAHSQPQPETGPLDFPGVPHEEEKILLDDDPGSAQQSLSEPGENDPTAEPIDLFADNEEEPEPGPEEPAPRKKGLFGRFKKK